MKEIEIILHYITQNIITNTYIILLIRTISLNLLNILFFLLSLSYIRFDQFEFKLNLT